MSPLTYTHTGKLSNSPTEATVVAFPSQEKIMDVAMADQYVLALSEGGNVFSWGKNTGRANQVCPSTGSRLISKRS